MASQMSIATAVDGCARRFLSLADELEREPRYATQIAPGAIKDEFDRFKLW